MMNNELNKEIEKAIRSRPLPFTVSYHGDSTIILDGEGKWCAGQVDRRDAEQICLSMNEAAKDRI